MSRSTMRRTVGVLVMEHIAVGLVEGHKVVGPLSIFPEKPQSLDPLQSMPAEGIVDCIRQHVDKVAGGEKIAAIGIGSPASFAAAWSRIRQTSIRPRDLRYKARCP